MDQTTEVVAVSISEIATLAAKAGAEKEARDAAIGQALDAEAAVLEAAIAAAKPGLRAVSSRIVRRDYSTSGRDGCNPVAEKEHHEERGLLLVDNHDRNKDASGNSGSYDGDRLYLLSDGRLARTEREGHWSMWQGSANEWTSTIAIVTPREAMGEYELDACLVAIRDALAKQLEGNGATVTKRSIERAEKFRAIASLAGGAS